MCSRIWFVEISYNVNTKWCG